MSIIGGAIGFDWSKDDPPSSWQMVARFVVSPAAIVAGAELFVGAIDHIAEAAGLSPLALALVLAPLATECPRSQRRPVGARGQGRARAVGDPRRRRVGLAPVASWAALFAGFVAYAVGTS